MQETGMYNKLHAGMHISKYIQRSNVDNFLQYIYIYAEK